MEHHLRLQLTECGSGIGVHHGVDATTRLGHLAQIAPRDGGVDVDTPQHCQLRPLRRQTRDAAPDGAAAELHYTDHFTHGPAAYQSPRTR